MATNRQQAAVDAYFRSIGERIPESRLWILDRKIDFMNTNNVGETIPRHLGLIADTMMYKWELSVADELGLSIGDREAISEKYRDKPELQG